MLTKSQTKYINSLKQKKNRESQGLFIAEGIKIVSALGGLNSSSSSIESTNGGQEGIKIRAIYSSVNFQLSIFNYPIEVIRIKENELKKISSLTTPNEVLAICEIPKYKLDTKTLSKKITLVLDTIQDPGNLGTIIRVADWFGIENIICSNDTVEVYNPKVVQATMGSIARVKVHHVQLEKFLSDVRRQMPDVRIFGAVLNGENLYEKNLSKEGMIVIGNESKGISDELLPFITDKIKIPSYSNGATSAESLNAAIAAAIICSEFRR